MKTVLPTPTPPHHQLPSNHPPQPAQPISSEPSSSQQSQSDPSLPSPAPSPPQTMMQSRPQQQQYYIPRGPGPSPQRFVTVRQSPGQPGTQVVQVVKPGGQGVVGQHPQQQRGQFQLVQQPNQGRQVVIRQQQQQQQHPQQQRGQF